MVRYANGSTGNLLYLTQGGAKIPKEYVEVFGGGIAAQLHNFESVVTYDNNSRKQIRSMGVDKGQRDQLKAFVDSVRYGKEMPIPAESLFETTLLTLGASESMRTNKEIEISTDLQSGEEGST